MASLRTQSRGAGSAFQFQGLLRAGLHGQLNLWPQGLVWVLVDDVHEVVITQFEHFGANAGAHSVAVAVFVVHYDFHSSDTNVSRKRSLPTVGGN